MTYIDIIQLCRCIVNKILCILQVHTVYKKIAEPKKGVLDTLKENKEKAAKQPSKPPVDKEKTR